MTDPHCMTGAAVRYAVDHGCWMVSVRPWSLMPLWCRLPDGGVAHHGGCRYLADPRAEAEQLEPLVRRWAVSIVPRRTAAAAFQAALHLAKDFVVRVLPPVSRIALFEPSGVRVPR